MNTVIIGGRLQGVETAYLAKKSGWHTTVVDMEENVPAAGICDKFECGDATDTEFVKKVLCGADFIIPAIENFNVLSCVKKCADSAGIPMLYDEKAYNLSSSKIASNQFFTKYGIPAPKPYPECGFPVIVKPSEMSGSTGVTYVKNSGALKSALDGINGDAVIEEYLSGPSYSIEVISYKGIYLPIQITDLGMDKRYDCCTVIAPTELSDKVSEQFRQIAVKISQNLDMDGIFDIEVIENGGLLKVLEIDARFPSQTPTAVYHSSRINMLDVLWKCYSGKSIKIENVTQASCGCQYFHVKVSKNNVEICGEHIMSDAGRLHLQKDFFGADEALTNYAQNRDEWVATLIVKGKDRDEACRKADAVINRLKQG